MNRIDEPKKQASIALKKAQSNIKKILQMIDEDKYCIDIMVQISATNGLLKSASDKILKNHMRTCFTSGMAQQNSKVKERLIQEVLNVVDLNKK
jgi:DNA-binding FrmR family transcriptional regulator